jgi:serine/threonine-protein kinase
LGVPIRTPRRIVVLAGVLLAGVPAIARADCAADCASAYRSCGDDPDVCLSQQGVCLSRCGLGGGERHGAIAYSPEREVYGYSYDFGSANEAAAAALGNCREQDRKADDCEVMVTFHNACGALALGDNGAYGTAWGWSKREAGTKAVTECRPYGGTSCKVEREVCSGTR